MSRQIKGKYAKAKKELEIIVLYTAKLPHMITLSDTDIANRLRVLGVKHKFEVPTDRSIYRWLYDIRKHSDLNYELKQMLKHKRKAEIHLIDNKIHITIDLD